MNPEGLFKLHNPKHQSGSAKVPIFFLHGAFLKYPALLKPLLLCEGESVLYGTEGTCAPYSLLETLSIILCFPISHNAVPFRAKVFSLHVECKLWL